MRRIRRFSPLLVLLVSCFLVAAMPSTAAAHSAETTAPFVHVGGGAGFYQGSHPRPHFEVGGGFHTFLFYATGGFQLVYDKPGPFAALGLAIPIPIVKPLIGLRFSWLDLASTAFRDFSLHVQIGAIIRKPKFPLAFMFTVEPGGWGLVKSGGFSGANNSVRFNANLVIYPPVPPHP